MVLSENVLNLIGLGIVVLLIGGAAAWIPGAVIRLARLAIG